MNAKLALKSSIAFVVALLVGHFVFPAFTRSANVKDPKPMPQVALAPEKGDDKAQTLASTKPEVPSNVVNREFKKTDAGFKNENVRMNSTFSNVYLGGITHTLPKGDKQVTWKPSAQEIRQNGKLVEVAAMPEASEAHVEDHDGLQHVVYSGTFADTDEHLSVRPEGGIEHDIILKKQPPISEGFGLAYSGYLTFSEGITIWDGNTKVIGNYTTKNGLAFKDTYGRSLFYLWPPVAFDATVANREGHLDVEKQALPQNIDDALTCEYQLTFDAMGVKLAVVAPGKWLMAEKRAYPVTIDPNFGPGLTDFESRAIPLQACKPPSFGPNGLADASPPIYVGNVGTGVHIPLAGGGTKLKLEEPCPGKIDNDYGHIPMPFDFVFYGVTFPAGTFFFVHVDGWASWDPPSFKYCDEIPCNPLEDSCFDNPQPVNSFGAIPNGAYPTDGAIYGLWNDLEFSTDASRQSAIYYLVDGVAPNRRLIIEWHNMKYVRNNEDLISFNIILYECANTIEVIVGGDPTSGDDQYYGNSTIGIESPGDAFAVVFDTFADPAPGTPNTCNYDGLDVQFTVSPFGTVKLGVTNNIGCVPLNTCFTASVDTKILPCQQQAGPPIIPSYSFHWTFGDGTEAFTANVCHIYRIPNNYSTVGINAPRLTVTDALGHTAVFDNLIVDACDIPQVIMTVTPQGGPAPLTIDVKAYSVSAFVPMAPATVAPGFVPTISPSYTDATTAIQVDLLGSQNEPGVVTPYQTLLGGTGGTVPTREPDGSLQQAATETIESTVTFDAPGFYRVEGVFPATSFTLPTTGIGTVFIDVTDPNSSTNNSMMITSSGFHIDWAGKIKNALGIAPRPADDTITVTGYLNLVGLDLSTIAGQQITLALNAYNPIFQGTLDGNGNAVQGDATTGKTGSFSISMPSGKFTCSVKGDFATSLGLTDVNATSLLTAHYRVQIGNVFNSPGTAAAYGYSSFGTKQATGSYTFGKYFTKGSFYSGAIPGAPGGSGSPAAQELLISGGFLVTSADFKLLGDTVTAKITGLLARAGGDDLRPSASSNVVVTIGNLTETLNFTTTPTFKTTGKAPSQKFSFKSKGGTNIKTLSWINKQGNFSITTYSMPNAQVGIDPQKGRQPINLTFKVTPDNNLQFIGTTSFDIIKVSDTEFKH